MSFGQIGVDVNVQVEVKDLKQILETLDRFRAMAGDNGDLAKRIDQLKKDMSDLIDQAERAGGHLEQKVVLDFIEQREATFKDLFRLEKKVFGDTHDALRELQSGMMSVPASFNLFADRFGRDFALQLTGITPLLPFSRGDHLLDAQGTRLAFQAKGTYPTTTFVLKEAFGVGLRMNDKVFQPTPESRFETRVGFDFPASQFAEQFQDTEPTPIPIEIVDHDKKNAIRYTGAFGPGAAVSRRILPHRPRAEWRSAAPHCGSRPGPVGRLADHRRHDASERGSGREHRQTPRADLPTG